MLSKAIFISLLVFYLFLGYKFYLNRKIEQFVFWSVLLPFTPSLTVLHTNFQVTAYYAFCMMPIILYTFSTLYVSRVNKDTIYISIIVFMFMLFYIPLGLFNRELSIDLINVLKDVKPIISLLLGFVFLSLLMGKEAEWGGIFSLKLLKINFYVTIIGFILLNTTNIIGFFTSDPFYENSETRYLTLGTFYVIMFFISKLSVNQKIKIHEFVFILTPIFLSGNRTFFLVMAVLFLVSILMTLSNIKLLLKRISLVLVGLLMLVAGIFNFNEALKYRFYSLFDFENLIKELSERRFAPFFEQISSFEWHHYFIGKGLGETFFIPWFVYRDNIDNFNINMDNLYLTLFVKYGLGMLVLLYILIHFVCKTKTNNKFKTLVLIYFSIMGLTTSFMYQTSFLFLLILLAGFKTSERKPMVQIN